MFLMKQPGRKEEDCLEPHEPRGSSSPAFLLAQVGAHAASKFAERLRELELTPAHAGMLRILAVTPGITQQALAAALGALPSRLVALVDELEANGLLERQSDNEDRCRYSLRLTGRGVAALQTIGRIAREHQQKLLAALSEEERRQLASLLQRVANEQGLVKGVHPGYAGLPQQNSKHVRTPQ
jgi:DNA-binding MarR family transcriptional regulator